MDILRPVLIDNSSSFCRCMLFIFAIFMAPVAIAQDITRDSSQVCEISSIEKDFKQYVNTSNLEEISTIQNQLNASDYGPVDVDGVIGPGTRLALQQLCLDYQLNTADALANHLVKLLQMTANVSEKHAKWRQFIQENAFKTWLNQTDQQQQGKISATLQAGPADQVIAILDEFAAEQASTQKKSKPVTTKASSQGLSEPTVFYRWQVPEEEESEETGNAEETDQAAEDTMLPDDVMNALGSLEEVAFPNEFLFAQALDTRISESDIDYKTYRDQYKDQIIKQAVNGPNQEAELLHLSDDSCGCSRDFSSLVVGFYPFWQAVEQDRVVDFSLFDRMDLYAFSLDKDNRLQAYPNWDNEHTKDFFKKAHKYKVKVDHTIYLSNWQHWEQADLTRAAELIANYAAQNIEDAVLTEGKDLASSNKKNQESSKNADGITLYFDDYRKDASGKIITDFIEQLTGRLTPKDTWLARLDRRLELVNKKGYDLNIILGMGFDKDKETDKETDTDTNEQLFEALLSILEEDSGPIDNVYLFLQEPTTDSKKNLRQVVEKAFKGEDRRTILRKIVPIISLPINYNEEYKEPITQAKDPDQFEDDLIYFQDNFAGVGFWPLPLGSIKSSDRQTTILEEKLTRLFKVKDSSNHLRGMLDTYAPTLCEFACPNRWWFRIGFDVLLVLLVLYALLAVWICRLRAFYKHYFLYFLAVGLATVLIFFISLVCDPFWMKQADTVLIVIFLVVVAATILRYVRKAIQPPLP